MKDARSKIKILRGELLERSEPPQNINFPNFAIKPALLKEAVEHFIELDFYARKETRSVVAEYAKFVGLDGIAEISGLIRAAAREGKMQMFSPKLSQNFLSETARKQLFAAQNPKLFLRDRA